MAKLRGPTAQDAERLADLMTQLGYPCEATDIPGRLERLISDPDVLVTVAEHGGRVVGVVTGHFIGSLHKTEPVAMLTALVVLERARGHGVGRLLVAHVEQWARARGATTISLTSALRRVDAHGFYKQLGYEHTGVRLAKALT